MVKSCCVFGCMSRSDHTGKGVSFHRLPTDKKVLKKWLLACRTESVRVNSNTRVCGKHFPGGRRSSPREVPSIFTWTVSKAERKPPATRHPLRTRQNIIDPGASDHASEDGEPSPVIQPGCSSPGPTVDETTALRAEVNRLEEHLDELKAENSEALLQERERAEEVGLLKDETTALKAEVSLLTERLDELKAENSEVLLQEEKRTEEVVLLKERLNAMEAEYALLKERLQVEATLINQRGKPRFSIHDIQHDDALVRFYTGLPDYEHFEKLSVFFSDCSATAPLWRGTGCHDGIQRQTTANRSLPLDDELFLTLMKLRLNCPMQDLALRFQISMTTVSRIFTTWLALLYQKLCVSAALPNWPTRERVDETMPQVFKDLYPSTRCVIDCTEFPIEVPSDPDTQRVTWSSYKNRNTFKALVGITPSGAISYLSQLFGGSVSDREITVSSGIVEKMERGDSLMADKGFTIRDVCEEHGVTLNMPPFIHDKQLSAEDLVKTRRIASLRIHVERAMERIKNFHILDFIPAKFFDIADQLFQVCALLSDLDKRLVD